VKDLLRPYEIMILILISIKRYADERGRDITRLRLSSSALRRITGRQRLHDSILNDVIEQLGLHGWTAFPIRDGLALIQSAAVDGWTKMSARRVGAELRAIAKGRALDIGKLEAELGIDDVSDLTDDPIEEEEGDGDKVA
jgi:hypothetical protein